MTQSGYERDNVYFTAKEKLVAGAVSVALVLGLGYFAIGTEDERVPFNEDHRYVTERYGDLYSRQSPEGRFLLQYVKEVQLIGKEDVGGRGLIDLFSSRDGNHRVFQFNNACLRNTAYDTGGGFVDGHFNGLFSHGEVTGRSPTAVAIAHVSREEPNILEIRAGNNTSKVLRFNGATKGDRLTPADNDTEDALLTHGCKTGIVESRTEYLATNQIG